MGELMAIGALVLVALAAVAGAIWQARRAGAAGAQEDALEKAIERAKDATEERAAVDGVDDPLAELRRDHSRH